MNLKNYTTDVPAIKSVLKIEEFLVSAGARNVMKEYDNEGRPQAIIFSIPVSKEQPPLCVKVPANVKACQDAMWRDYCTERNASRRPSLFNKTSRDFEQQGERVAWRIILDWVEVQVSLIRLNQMDTVQAFLPYVWDGERTVYEKVKAGGFAALMPPKPEPSPEHENTTTIEV
jgi:hypothetical protein